MRVGLVCFILLQSCFPAYLTNLRFFEEKEVHIPRSLTNDQLSKLSSQHNDSYFMEALQNILVPRVVGTPSHENVKEYIKKEMTNLEWDVEEDSFLARTPNLGELKFTNLISRLNNNASRYLILACHYDSKYFPRGEFLGATDSAVPCAMMLHIAKVLKEQLSFAKTSDLSLMYIFFDGEEAFHQWSEHDSLYGARNLASKWSQSPFPNENSYTDELDRIDVLILLDLLGVRNPIFYSYFQNTARWHSLLVNIERRLKSTGAISQNLPHQFLEKSTYSDIEDDHIPFLRRSVPVLHIIPSPFPKVWHTLADDMSALDFPTIKSTSTIIQTFLMSYLMGETPK